MKINEKNLTMFAISPPVDLEGWLSKRGEVNRSWQRRYFVLKGNLLFYFEKRGDREPLGVIILEGCTIELAEEGEQYCFQIVFHGMNNRTYVLSAESQDLMEQWMKALTCAGYEYMKLMVAELQRQLEEIEGTKAPTPIQQSPVAPKPPPRRQNPFNRPAPAPPVNGKDASPSSTIVTVVPSQAASLPPRQPESYQTKHSIADLIPIGHDLDFMVVHAAFGGKIQRELDARRAAKEAAQTPLILF